MTSSTVEIVLWAALVSTLLFIVFNLWLGGITSRTAKAIDPFPASWRG